MAAAVRKLQGISYYTAGPWTYEEEMVSGPHLTKAAIFAHGDVIGQAYEDSFGGNCQANARLMACAPRLLDELKSVTDRFERTMIHFGADPQIAAIAVREARAIIAKANGQS